MPRAWIITSMTFTKARGINPHTMFYTYVLKSLKDNDLYWGSTNDLRKRLAEHNKGLVFSTKNRVPFELVYYEAYRAESDARHREHNLKLRSNAYSQLKKRISASLNWCGGE